jgi:hypothetical protein
MADQCRQDEADRQEMLIRVRERRAATDPAVMNRLDEIERQLNGESNG